MVAWGIRIYSKAKLLDDVNVGEFRDAFQGELWEIR